MFHFDRISKTGRSVRFILVVLCITAVLIWAAACDLPFMDTEDPENETEEIHDDPTTTESAAETTAAETTPVETTAAPPTTLMTEPTISNPESMYTSYAHLESFDPATGLAQFDYFDMLRGQDAIDWLVAHEGYTLADATALVNDFADSEFVYKNVNPQLRTADMQDVTIRMMYEADGTQMPGADTTPLSYSEFVTLYTAHPAYVLNSFFYRVIVSDGIITEVHQVYWP